VTDAIRRQAGYVLIGALVAAGLYATLFVGEGAADVVHGEDKAIEYLGALALLVAAVAFFLCFLRTRGSSEYTPVNKLAFLLLALAFLFGAGEEISWGQRILGVETPQAIAESNAQQELTFHNLSALDGVFTFENAFQLFWLGFGVAIPLLCALSATSRRLVARLMPILPLWLAVLFIVQQANGELVQVFLDANPGLYHDEAPLAANRFEITETILAALLAIGALLTLREASARRAQADPALPQSAARSTTPARP